MAIASFRACRRSLRPEQLREAATSLFAADMLKAQASACAKAAAVPDSTPAVYHYDYRRDGSHLCGIVALLKPDALKQLRCPMPAEAADVAFARECLDSKREQLAPVVVVTESLGLETFEAVFKNSPSKDELSIEPVTETHAISELNAALADSPMTVIAGPEWIAAADGHPVMALLVNGDTCAPELQPVHRCVRWKPSWHAGDMVRLGRENFFFHDITRLMPQMGDTGPHYFKPTAIEYLRPNKGGENVLVAVTARHTFRIHSLPGWADTVLAHRTPEERGVGVVQLHEILMTKGLEMPPGSFGDQEVAYTLDMDEAVECVKRGQADVAFLMNAPTIEQIVSVARIGGTVPRHAFRPRLVPVPGAITYAF